jgi:hypothetical protein
MRTWGYWSVIVAVLTLQTEALVAEYFAPATYLVRPLRAYALNDASELTGSSSYDQAPDASYFGQLKRTRTAFLAYGR